MITQILRTSPLTPSNRATNTRNYALLLPDQAPYQWLSSLHVVGTHSETLTAFDGGAFTGYMFEVTHVPHGDATTPATRATPATPPRPGHKYVWCIARRYRQFNQLREDFLSVPLRALKVPKKGWIWSSSTDATLVAERLSELPQYINTCLRLLRQELNVDDGPTGTPASSHSKEELRYLERDVLVLRTFLTEKASKTDMMALPRTPAMPFTPPLFDNSNSGGAATVHEEEEEAAKKKKKDRSTPRMVERTVEETQRTERTLDMGNNETKQDSVARDAVQKIEEHQQEEEEQEEEEQQEQQEAEPTKEPRVYDVEEDNAEEDAEEDAAKLTARRQQLEEEYSKQQLKRLVESTRDAGKLINFFF